MVQNVRHHSKCIFCRFSWSCITHSLENVNKKLHCKHQHVIDVSRQRNISLTCNEVFISRWDEVNDRTLTGNTHKHASPVHWVLFVNWWEGLTYCPNWPLTHVIVCFTACEKWNRLCKIYMSGIRSGSRSVRGMTRRAPSSFIRG